MSASITVPPVQERPLVSIVIPTYNRAALVVRAIDSVLAQTYPRIEVIVVDDGSSDATDAALAPYVARGVRVVRHARNMGTTAAKNTGIDAMTGAFGGILDSDDELVPDAVATLMRAFDDCGPGFGMVFGNCVDPATGAWTGVGLDRAGEVSFRDAVTGRFQGEFWGLWRRAVIGNRRFDPSLPGGSESLVWHELYRVSRVYYVHAVVRRYARRSADSVTRANLEPAQLERTRVMYERYLAQFGDDMRRFDRHAYVKQVQLVALWYLLAGRRREAIVELGRSVRAGASGAQVLRALIMAVTPRAILRRVFEARYERSLRKTTNA